MSTVRRFTGCVNMGERPRRKSRVVFWILMLAIIAGIIATALLANDKRNLRELIQRYKITWINVDDVISPKVITTARRGNRLIPSASNLPTRLPLHALDSFQTPPSAFLRRWQVSGEQLCSAFRKAGLDVEDWHQGNLYASTYECSAQVTAGGTSSSEPASLFLIVRGTPAGDVSSVRFKVILPATDDGRAVQKRFNRAVEILFRESKWVELDSALEQVRRLENIRQSTSGARLVFAHEFTDSRRFNLILDLSGSTSAERSTAAYFDRSKWIKQPSTP